MRIRSLAAPPWTNPAKAVFLLAVMLLNVAASENITSSTKSTTTADRSIGRSFEGNDGFCESTYRLTECENGRNRWRVAVPSSSACMKIRADTSQVRRLSTCDVSCPSGHHFNLTSLHCETCQPGTFAAGPTLHITDWNLLPEGMTAENNLARVNSGSSLNPRMLGGDGRLQRPNCDDDYGWQALGDSVGILIPSTSCVNILYYPVTLAKAGFVSFSYRYVRSSDVLFQFDFLHGCRSRLDTVVAKETNSIADGKQWGMRWPNSTLPFVPPADEWTQMYVALPAGETTLKWSAISTTLGALDDAFTALRTASAGDSNAATTNQRQPPIQIREVIVDGLTGETLSCTPCAPGMFASDSGNGKCEPCAQNSYAEQYGSTACKPCDTSTFAPAGSATCEPKPSCVDHDVSALVMDSTNKNARAQCFPQLQKKSPPPVAHANSNKVSLHYKWSPDALCNSATSSVALPARKLIQCGEVCSSGTQLTLNHDSQQLECTFCARGTYRSGIFSPLASNFNGSRNVTTEINSHCQPCTANKLPRSGMWFTKFLDDVANWPSEVLNSTCYSSIRGGCFSQNGFRPNGEALVSQRGVDGAVMVLQLHVDGFDANMPAVQMQPPEQENKFSSNEDYYPPQSKRQLTRQGPAIGLLEFEFEMHCKTKQCFLELMLADIRSAGSTTDDSMSSQTMPVQMWDYRHAGQGRIRYSIPFYRNASFTALWTYSKFSLSELSSQKLQKFRLTQYLNDFVAFYSINVTNAIGGGADSCVADIDEDEIEENATSSRQQQQKCNAAHGEYWNSKLHRCVRCSQFERLSSAMNNGGKQFCVACGHNLIADENRSHCYSPCRIPFGKKTSQPFTAAHHNQHLLLPQSRPKSLWMSRKPTASSASLNFPLNAPNNLTDKDENGTHPFDWQNFIDLSAFRNQPLNVKSADFNFEGDQSSFQYNFHFALCGNGGEDTSININNGLQVECRENMSVLWKNTLFQSAVGSGGVNNLMNSMSASRGYGVHGAVCRTSLVAPPDDRIAWLGFRVNSAAPVSPSAADSEQQRKQLRRRLVSTAPVVLADELVGIYTSLDILEQEENVKKNALSKTNSSDSSAKQQHEHTLNVAVDEYFWDKYVEGRSFQRGNAPDVHFVFALSQRNRIGGDSHPNRKCQNNNKHVVITLQCVRDARRNGTVVLPPHCPTGTCDGCTYRFLMLTDQVCPPCIENGVDYREVVEQCGSDGRQRVTRQPLVSFCRVDLPSMVEWRECSVIPRWLLTLMLLLFLMLLLLMLVVLAQWNRTKTLQYKYSKLMAQSEYEADMAQEQQQDRHTGGGGGGGQLPHVESCAMEVDDDEVANEEDEDEFFTKQQQQANGSQTKKINKSSSRPEKTDKPAQRLPMREISLNDDTTVSDGGAFPTAHRVHGSHRSSTIFGRVRNLLHSSSATTPSPSRGGMQRIDELALDTRDGESAPPSRSGTRRSDRRGHSAQSNNRRHFYNDGGEAVEHTASTAAAAAAAEASRNCGIDNSDTAYLVTNSGGGGSPDEDDSGAHTQLLA